jgi:DNA repair exonuclease SbcCD ATPase subunit
MLSVINHHKEYLEELEKLELEYDQVRNQLRSEKKDLKKAKQRTLDIKEAIEAMHLIAETLQQKAHKQLSGVVTTCLQTVFGSDYTFRIDFESKRNRTEAKLVLVKNGNDIDDPLNDDSGGVADVASFALRLSSIMMSKPHRRKFLGLDEPFKFVSAEYRPALVELLNSLTKELGFQIVMVTHIRDLEVGKVVRL